MSEIELVEQYISVKDCVTSWVRLGGVMLNVVIG